MSRRLLYIEDVSMYIHLPRKEIEELVVSGELKARRLGKRTVFLREDLDAFLDNLPYYEPNEEKKGN